MREIPLSLCERTLVNKVSDGFRIDGRNFLEFRPWKINFGKDYGCCSVSLGDTQVLAQVSCEVVEPRPSRPNEGKIGIFVNISQMAAAHFEQGRTNDISDEIQEILNRNIKQSGCLDVESLCIMAEDSVWQLRVDITVLNHSGNLADACNVAAVSALKHFHRPDVTVEEDGRVTIHTSDEKELIPTYMMKIPVCITYGFFMTDDHCYTIMDPSDTEERVLSGKLMVGLNPFGEITSLIFPGKIRIQEEQIISCIENANSQAKKTAEMVANAVESDIASRQTVTKSKGFLDMKKCSHKEWIINDRLNGTPVDDS